MTTIRKIVTSQIDGNSANTDNEDEIRPFGEAGFYIDNNGNTDKLVLSMFEGQRTHLRSKVLSPGVFYGSNADSGDETYGFDTIKLIPDAELHFNDGNFGNDQHIVVDPTGPNHIHIRAGGTQDNSGADLYVGGEKNFLRVSDGSDNVIISTDAGEGNTWNWTFDNLGKITLPNDAVIAVDEGGSIEIRDVVNFNVEATGTISIYTDVEGTGYQWQFGDDGTLIVPDASEISGLNSITVPLNEVLTVNLSTQLGLDPLTQYSISIQPSELKSNNDIISISTTNNHAIILDETEKRVNIGNTPSGEFIRVRYGTATPGGLANGSAQIDAGNWTAGLESSVYLTAQNKTWQFRGVDSSIVFPDTTVQTTAWAGGRVVSAPGSSLGTTGDKEGDIAFNGSHIYYCTADYSATPVAISWSNVSEYSDGMGDHYVQADIADPSQLNGTLSITNVSVSGGPLGTETVTSFAQISGNTYKFYLTNSEPWQIYQSSQLQVVPNIWRRVAWSGDTW